METFQSARLLPNQEHHGITEPAWRWGRGVKRFAQKEICYCTIQKTKASARPAEITFFHKQAISGANVA